MNAFSHCGFAVGDVRGTRAWKVDTRGRLRGVVFEKIWRPGENVAECLRGQQPTGQLTRFSAGGLPGGGGSGGGNSINVTFRAQVPPAAGPQYCPCGCGLRVPGSDDNPDMRCSGIDPDCGCGFYGYQEGSNDYYNPQPGTMQKGPIGGVFRGYGKVVLGTHGFRAEKAEILALYVDSEALLMSGNKVADSLIRMRVEENYKVPVFGDYLDLLKEFPPDKPELPDNFWEAS